MRYEDVKSLVGTEVESDLDDLYEQFKLVESTADLDKFASFLHREGLISEHTFRELHGRSNIDLAPFATLADDLFRARGGTMFPDDFEGGSADADLPDVPIRMPYSYRGKIGEGAMGEVHVAVDHNLNRKIAFKQMTHKTAGKTKLAARFYQEAQITAQLDHPNIVPVYGLEASQDGRLGYSMKLIRGHTFSEIIQQVREHSDNGTPLPDDLSLDDRIEHFLKVCDAIEFAHSRGVVHRDLKPENIMVGPFNEVYVMDWGIARKMGDIDDTIEPIELKNTDTDGHKTKVGAVIGTPAYMSPEQAEGRNNELDGRSDQFSLGLILFELVTLQRAIVAKTAMAMVVKVQGAELEPLHHYAGLPIDRGLRAIIGKATALRTEDRYANVHALGEDLRRWLRGDAVQARSETIVERIGRWTRGHLELVAAIASSVIAFFGLIIIGMLVLNLYSLRMAEQREEALGELLQTVSRQGAFIDGHLLGYEGLVESLASTTLEALKQGEPGPVPAFASAVDFEAPDLVPSTHYGTLVSPNWPVFRLADSDADVASDLFALSRMRAQFRRVLLQSARTALLFTPREKQDQYLFDTGVPFARAYVALENGLSGTYPGYRGVPPGFDARRRAWYQLAQEATSPKWGNPHADIGGLGLVLPCSAPLIDDNGNFRGVVAIEVTFDYVLKQLLDAPILADRAEAFILDDRAKIVIRSSESRNTTHTVGGRSLRRKSFPIDGLEALMAAKPSGYVTADYEGVSKQIVYYRMDSLGWYYVIMGDVDALL